MKQKNEQGVRVPFWVWASATPTYKESVQVKEQAPAIGNNDQSSKDLPVLDAEVPDVNQLLVENPDTYTNVPTDQSNHALDALRYGVDFLIRKYIS